VRGSTVDGRSGCPAGGLVRGGPVCGTGGGTCDGPGVVNGPGAVNEGDVEGSVDGPVIGSPDEDGSPVRGSVGADEGKPERGSTRVAGKPVRESMVDCAPSGALGPSGVDGCDRPGRCPGSGGDVEPVWAMATVAAPSTMSADAATVRA
jgi:hypothetical protein